MKQVKETMLVMAMLFVAHVLVNIVNFATHTNRLIYDMIFKLSFWCIFFLIFPNLPISIFAALLYFLALDWVVWMVAGILKWNGFTETFVGKNKEACCEAIMNYVQDMKCVQENSYIEEFIKRI